MSMEYAPVCIVTLNRYEHFRKCLESLEQCTGANKTEVFVSLDYPPSEKYIEGWKKTDAFLAQKEQNNCFKKLNVIRRKHNCGVGNPHSNGVLLGTFIREHYGRYIITEDDNVFSPNFLEYINKGLDKFENDASVSAVTGYCIFFPFKTGNDNFFMHNSNFSAWGYGVWTNKQNQIIEEIKNGFFNKSFCLKNYLKVRERGFSKLLQYLSLVLKPKKEYIWITDNVLSVYNIVNDKYVVVPAVSKVRNEGWDMLGYSFSGKNGKNRLGKYGGLVELHTRQEIDTELSFNYIGKGAEYIDYNNQVAVVYDENKISYLAFLKKVCVLFVITIAKSIGLKKLKKRSCVH